jgi:iron complex outermembrane receptor protein
VPALAAGQQGSGESGGDERLEIVLVTGVRMTDNLVLETSRVAQSGIDNSDLLRLFPGGNRNANGPLSRISQYRGLFGAQNSVSIDSAGYTADCPNWMDTPLSSIPQSLTASVTLYRGLGSVATIAEGLGGSIHIESRRGEFAEADGWSSYGYAEAGYGSNASSWGAALFAGLRDRDNWLDFAVSSEQGDDYTFDGGVAAATEYDREQYRFGYGRRIGQAELALGASVNRTGPSGTPALPMDMRYVDSEQYTLEWEAPLGAGRMSLQASTLSVEHMMDNFTLRPPPLNPMGKPGLRQSDPVGDTESARLSYALEFRPLTLEVGLDGKWEAHSAQITDPTSERFYIVNFNAVERDRRGLYGTATGTTAGWGLELGLRYNRVDMNAGEVGGDLATMPSTPARVQQERLDELAEAFNASDRRRSDDQWSGILKASRGLGRAARLNLGLGRKVRSPSYQERYLWLPLEATAGLADGRTYIGDIALRAETSLEVTAGIDWQTGNFKLTPEAFYRDVSDFIQGVPSTNRTANLFAVMMGGEPPLQYANVEAELYGVDLGYEWRIAEAWLLRGNLGYVRGRRTDEPDNLYRIAPLSSFLELVFSKQRYYLSAQSVAAARQDRVAAYNDEQATAGWGVLHLRAGLRLNETFNLGLGVENLFDKVYQDHLGGYNRVRDSDIPLGVRLYSTGRNFYLRLNASW